MAARVLESESPDTLALLTEVLAHDEQLTEAEREAFTEWRERLGPGRGRLTPRQRAWLHNAARRLGLSESTTNEWSSRTPEERELIRGRDVPTPDVLKRENLPMRPPRRNA